MPLYLRNRLDSYVKDVLVILAFAAYYWILVILDLLRTGDLQTLVDLPKLRDLAFAKLWITFFTGNPGGEKQAGNPNPRSEKQAVIPPLLSTATGTVLELGPGAGSHLPFLSSAPGITKIYGVEPSLGLHPTLRTAIKRHHLTDTYEILSCGIEDSTELARHGILPGTIDTIISMQVLCSVPDPELVAKNLYELLKPGGQMLVYEHLRSEDTMTRFMQRAYNLVWPLAVANCHLDRRTGDYLREAGKWERVELGTDVRDEPWAVFPRVWGRLVKAED